MRAALDVLLENLRALKREGVQDVFVSDEALAALRESVARAARNASEHAGTRAENVPAKTAEKTVARAQTISENREKPPRERAARAPERESDGKTAAVPAQEKSEFDPAASSARVAAVPATGTKTARLTALESAMLGDPVCNAHLHAGKKLVFGEGNPDAAIFFCGEAPGAEEESSGRPFVGPAGQLLTKMIAAMNLAREQVYIGNILKWRPETGTAFGNRPPTPEEMNYCLPYIVAQAEIVAPRVIVALGLTAVNGLFGFDPQRRIGAMRGKNLEFRGVPVVATFHPSYLLRNDTTKSKRAAWEDFLRAMELASIPISERQRRFFLPKSA